jgi:hypothetical protein
MAALYLKLKSKSDFLPDLLEMNNRLAEPIEEEEVEDIYKSATSKDFQIFGQCKKPPCVHYCDRALCKLRKYGVGKNRANVVSDIEFGKVIRVKAADPYYLIEVRRSGTEEYKQVVADAEADLLNQKVIQQLCMRYLNYVPVTLKQDVWQNKLNNEIFANIEDQEVPRETDTSERAEIQGCILRYLTHAQVNRSAASLIWTGSVYYENGMYYFSTNGLKKFMQSEHVSFTDVNLRSELVAFGCEDAEYRCKTSAGADLVIRCWRKDETEELRDTLKYIAESLEDDTKIIREEKTKTDTEGDHEDNDARF